MPSDGPAAIGRRAEVRLLLALCAAGLVLRVTGLSHGLPDHIFHPDTPKQLVRVARYLAGELIPPDTYPALHMYVVALLLKALAVVDPHAYETGPSPTQVAVTARLLNAVLSTGLVPLVYAIGRTLLDWRVGALAAALTAVSGLGVLHAHYEMGDGPQAFFALAAVAVAARVHATGRATGYLLAGALAGLAMSAKLYGVLALGALVPAALVAPPPRARRVLLLAGAGVTALAVFAVTTPKLLAAPLAWLDALRASREFKDLILPPLAERPWVGGKIVAGLALEWLGPATTLLAVAGAAYLLVRCTRRGLVVLATPALVVALYVVARTTYLDERNLLILAPFASLCAAAALVAAGGWGRVATAAAALTAGVVLLASAGEAVHVAALFRWDDTRLFALRWRERELPPGVRIETDRYHASAAGYASVDAELLQVDSLDHARFTTWYSPLRVPRISRALEFLESRGKLLARFELLPRAFTSPTLAYYDLTALTPPHVFPPPDDVAGLSDSLVFVDPDAVPRHAGVLVERGSAAARTLVSRAPLAELGVLLSGVGRVRVRHGWRRVGVTLAPGEPRLVRLRPWRRFPWFTSVYRVTVEARDGQVHARLLALPCERAGAAGAVGEWRAAVADLGACRGSRWVEPLRLLELARAHAALGDRGEARRALDTLERTAPGLLGALDDLARGGDDDAWRERYRVVTGQSRWFWRRHTYALQAEAATARVGRVVETAGAAGGRVVRAAGTAEAGYVKLWFPQSFLRGAYLVRFRLRGAATGAGPLATLSVVRHFQRRVHDVPVSEPWRGRPGGDFTEVTLRVVTDLEPVKLEARVLYHGPGPLEIDQVAIVPDVRAHLAARLAPLRPLLATADRPPGAARTR